ncbi:MAG: hypothetical protein C4581_05955 [Nitrospiraceae bacterium]|nr:MAG: hypothetical protein C4581_05955 [Nitrospiraceae bacterium]
MADLKNKILCSAIGAATGLSGLTSVSNCSGGACTACFGCAGVGVSVLLLAAIQKIRTRGKDNGMA